jgi:hypothetical protein
MSTLKITATSQSRNGLRQVAFVQDGKSYTRHCDDKDFEAIQKGGLPIVRLSRYERKKGILS